jgi:hypothetical protein
VAAGIHDNINITGLVPDAGLAAISPNTTASPISVVESASQSTFNSLEKKAFKVEASITRLALAKKAIECITAPRKKMAAASARSTLEITEFRFTRNSRATMLAVIDFRVYIVK